MKLRHCIAIAILPLFLAACLEEAKQGSKQIPEFQGDTGGNGGGETGDTGGTGDGVGTGGTGGANVPVNAAVSVAFTDLDPDGGQIEGATTFTPADDESDLTEYRLYWGQDDTTKLAGSDSVIDTVLVAV